MNNAWFNLDRSETDTNRKSDREIHGGITVTNPALGIYVYKKAIPKDVADGYIETLENNLNGQTPFTWEGAKVTEAKEVVSEARNCVDFKVGQGNLGVRGPSNQALYDMHENAFRYVSQCVDDYGRAWGAGMSYFEVFNFVKYDGPGTHFRIHADHGPGYVATVSVVAYLNDEYEGGEIFFPRFNLTIKPEAGDIVVFPSTFVYEHASLEMVSGKKYCIVVMTDYNSRGASKSYDYRRELGQIIY